MKFFRRRRITQPPEPYTYRYELDLEHLGTPQPWRSREDRDNIFFLPVDFVLMFLDAGRFSQIKVVDADYIVSLRHDMIENGIHTPLELVMDSQGKVRLQEGHHRMAAALQARPYFARVPVTLRRTNGVIRAHSRMFNEAIEDIFRFLSSDRFYVPNRNTYAESFQ